MNKNTSPKLTPLTVTLSPGSDSKLQNYKAQAETLTTLTKRNPFGANVANYVGRRSFDHN